jgi:hypothetical protein
MTSAFRSRHRGRHSRPGEEVGNQPAVTAAPDWTVPVPAAQVAAERAASGPQPRLARSGPQPRVLRETQAFTPAFTRAPQPPQAPATPPGFTPLSRPEPVLFSRDPQQRAQEVADRHAAINGITYPPPGCDGDQYGHAAHYAAVAAYLDRLLGTRLPSADPAGRWADRTPAWPAPQAPDVPARGLQVTAAPQPPGGTS